LRADSFIHSSISTHTEENNLGKNIPEISKKYSGKQTFGEWTLEYRVPLIGFIYEPPNVSFFFSNLDAILFEKSGHLKNNIFSNEGGRVLPFLNYILGCH
jgi:hypothetical protein